MFDSLDPELRGNTTVIEYKVFMGGLYPIQEPSKIVIMTEIEVQGQRAAEMMKLAALANETERLSVKEESDQQELPPLAPAASP